MLARLSILFLLMIFFCSALGQVEVRNGSRVVSPQIVLYQFSDSVLFTEDGLADALAKPWSKYDASVKVSYQPKVLWMKIAVSDVASCGNFDLLYVNNPAINLLRVWVLGQGKIHRNFELTGDHTVYTTRQDRAPGFAFSISSAWIGDTIVIAVEKRLSKLDIPLEFYTNTDFQAVIQKQSLLYGLASGIILLLVFFNILLFATSKQNLYFYYSVYLLSALIYIGADLGLLFQYFYPQHPAGNDLIRPFSFAFSILPMMFFFNELLEIRKYSARMYRLNRGIVIAYSLIFLVALASSIWGDYHVQEKWLHVNSVLGPAILTIVLAESVYCAIKKIRFAYFALASFSCLAILIVIFSLTQNGLLPGNWFTLNSQYLAIAVDVTIVALSLVWRFKVFTGEALTIQDEYIQQQRTIFEESAAWQKAEMQRMSSFLHDSVGADLGLLRLKVDKMPLTENSRKELASMISNIGDSVRVISHQSSPLQLQSKGLYNAVEDMVRLIRRDSHLALQFEWLGEKDHLSTQQEIVVYRVLQELLQNVIKHSRATEAILQVMHEQTLFGIYIEDNGIGGEDWAQHKNGIGLKNIEHIVSAMKGHFSIDTQQGKGFSVSIEFPLNF